MAEQEQDKLLIRLHVYDTDLSVRIPREDEEMLTDKAAIRQLPSSIQIPFRKKGREMWAISWRGASAPQAVPASTHAPHAGLSIVLVWIVPCTPPPCLFMLPVISKFVQIPDFIYGVMLVALMAFRPDGILSYDAVKWISKKFSKKAVEGGKN